MMTMPALSIAELAKQLGTGDAAELFVRILIGQMSVLEPDDKGAWKKIVSNAVAGGLSKEMLSSAFSCSVMTINRWEAGQNVPAPMARKAIKAELIEMLERQAMSFKRHEVVPHLEAIAAAAD